MKTDQIMEFVCDNLCRYPSEYKDPDDLWNEQCDHCKLRELSDMKTMAEYIKRKDLIDRINGMFYSDHIKENFLVLAKMIPAADVVPTEKYVNVVEQMNALADKLIKIREIAGCRNG